NNEATNAVPLSRAKDRTTEIHKHLIFFDLEWVKVAKSTAKKLTRKSNLAKYRHWLEQKRVWKPYYLTEPEEKILDTKTMTGKSAFGRLFEETTATMTCPMNYNGTSAELSVQETLAKLYDADPEVRKAAAEGL